MCATLTPTLQPRLFAMPSSRPARPVAFYARRSGFSLIEVILSIGILAIAIVALLGLIGPTLGSVGTVLNTNAGVSAIAKMNEILDTTPFYNGTSGVSQRASVYTWIRNSNPAGANGPAIFFFYNELETSSGNVTPQIAVSDGITLPWGDPASPPTTSGNATPPFVSYTVLKSDAIGASGKSIDGPVIAMVLSLSPMAQDSTNGGSFPTGENYYTAPATGSLFPTASALPANPNTQSGANISYPEAYLPILVQAFTVPVDQIILGGTGGTITTSAGLVPVLIDSNRIFTYTTAKLR